MFIWYCEDLDVINIRDFEKGRYDCRGALETILIALGKCQREVSFHEIEFGLYARFCSFPAISVFVRSWNSVSLLRVNELKSHDFWD